MWDGLLILLLLCILMGGSSFLAGILPLSLTLSSRQLRLISALGTGVLVGTSLIVIIPEGIETLYSASASTGISDHGRMLARDAFPGALKHDTWRRGVMTTAVPLDVGLTGDGHVHCLNKRHDDDVPQDDASSGSGEGNTGGSDTDDDHSHTLDSDETSHDPHAWVGLSLITGFILMYLIDTLPKQHLTPTQPQRFQINLNQFSLTRARTSSVPETPTTATQSSSNSHSRPSSTTVGLVIHACADGIALGASSTTSTNRLSFIIFLALLIHKAPAAFGLTSVLLKQGLSKRTARAHLIVFSLAAPLGALLTWASAHLLGYSSAALGSSASTEFATGVLLLFSGGTFLYVAMHTMQESGGGHDHGAEAGMNGGYAGVPMTDLYDETAPGNQAGPKLEGGGGLTDTFVTVGGMLLPLVTQIGGHGH